ncbi:MAG: adenylyl-sulfate kinase [Bacteroidota bacterium]
MQGFQKHIVAHEHNVDKKDRNQKSNHNSFVVWFTGLSGSGKSTLASSLETFLHNQGHNTYILDGDNIRQGLNKDLDFSNFSRKENIRRLAEVSKLFVDAGIIVLTAFISPFAEDRRLAKKLIGEDAFVEVYVACPLEVCEQRDVKGLYKKARKGEIKYFTGIDSPFEEPENANIKLNTAENSIEECLIELKEKIEPYLNLQDV